jgi:hypothetical protein
MGCLTIHGKKDSCKKWWWLEELKYEVEKERVRLCNASGLSKVI